MQKEHRFATALFLMKSLMPESSKQSTQTKRSIPSLSGLSPHEMLVSVSGCKPSRWWSASRGAIPCYPALDVAMKRTSGISLPAIPNGPRIADHRVFCRPLCARAPASEVGTAGRHIARSPGSYAACRVSARPMTRSRPRSACGGIPGSFPARSQPRSACGGSPASSHPLRLRASPPRPQ